MVWEEVAGQGANVVGVVAVGPIETLEIIDSWWSRRRWLARRLGAL